MDEKKAPVDNNAISHLPPASPDGSSNDAGKGENQPVKRTISLAERMRRVDPGIAKRYQQKRGE